MPNPSRQWLKEHAPAAYEREFGTEAESRPEACAKGAPYTEYRSKTEARYAAVLDARDDVADWHYEAWKIRLGKNAWYTVDFAVLLENGHVEMHEVKGGYVRKTGKVKFRTAARLCPWYTWRMVQQTSKKKPFEEILTLP